MVLKAQEQHLAVGRRQARQGQPQLLALGQQREMGLAVVRAIIGHAHRTERNSPPAAAPHIDREVAGKAEEPGNERHTTVFKGIGPFQEAHKHIVGGIAGEVRVAEATQQVVEQAWAVGFIDPAQRVGVTAADTGDQVVSG